MPDVSSLPLKHWSPPSCFTVCLSRSILQASYSCDIPDKATLDIAQFGSIILRRVLYKVLLAASFRAIKPNHQCTSAVAVQSLHALKGSHTALMINCSLSSLQAADSCAFANTLDMISTAMQKYISTEDAMVS